MQDKNPSRKKGLWKGTKDNKNAKERCSRKKDVVGERQQECKRKAHHGKRLPKEKDAKNARERPSKKEVLIKGKKDNRNVRERPIMEWVPCQRRKDVPKKGATGRTMSLEKGQQKWKKN